MTTGRTVVAALLAVGVTLAAGACAKDGPPDWLTGLDTTTTTLETASTTTTPIAGAAGTGVTTTTAPGATTAVTDLTLGDCVTGAPFSGNPTSEATEAQVIACTSEHDGEVVGLVVYNDGPNAPYPGQDQVAQHADVQCAAAFGDYVGAAYGASPLSMVSLWPTEDSWASGDRQAVCVAYQDSGPLTATVQGSGAGA